MDLTKWLIYSSYVDVWIESCREIVVLFLLLASPANDYWSLGSDPGVDRKGILYSLLARMFHQESIHPTFDNESLC